MLEELVTPAVCFCAVGSSPKTQVLVLLSGTSTLSLQFPFYIIYHTVLSCVKDSYKLFSKSTFPSLRSVSCNNLYFGSSVLQQMAVWFVFSSCSVMGTQFVNVKLLTRTRGWIPRPPRSTALPGAQTQRLRATSTALLLISELQALVCWHCWEWQVTPISQSKVLIKVWIPKLFLYCASWQSNEGKKAWIL